MGFKFVCNKCICIDDSDLVLPDQMIVNEEYDAKSSDEMIESGVMLCSECNTGEWHGKFEKEEATVEEIALASFSKYNAITPYDQGEVVIIESESSRYGYKLAPVGIGMFNQMTMYAQQEGLSGFNVTQHPLYSKWMLEGDAFDVNELLNLKIEDIGKMIRENKLNGTSGIELSTSDDNTLGDIVNATNVEKIAESLKPKPHWKELQDEESKKEALAKAKAKRERKRLKKEGV